MQHYRMRLLGLSVAKFSFRAVFLAKNRDEREMNLTLGPIFCGGEHCKHISLWRSD
jgi:hypothetical protein